MSGRVKGAPADPAAEREQLRQLTRELHEAAKDARAAAKELRAARQDIDEAAGAAVDQSVIPYLVIARDHITAEQQRLASDIQKVGAEFAAQFRELAGAKTSTEFMNALSAKLQPTITAAIVETIAELLPEVARVEIERITGGSKQLHTTRRAFEAFMAQADSHLRHDDPQVIVATKDALDAYVAAGGDPGIVIDMRKT